VDARAAPCIRFNPKARLYKPSVSLNDNQVLPGSSCFSSIFPPFPLVFSEILLKNQRTLG
jgi:hypothetical protein